MRCAIGVELEKLRTVRSTWAITAGALALVAFSVTLTLAVTVPHGRDEIRSVLSFAGTAGLLTLVLGVVSATSEYRHRTIVTQRLVAPDAARLLVAKTIGLAIAGAIVGVAGAVLTDAIALPWLAADGVPVGLSFTQLMRLGVGGMLYCSLSAALGVGVGALMRSQVAAVTAATVALFVIIPTVSALVPQIGRFGPTALGAALSGSPDIGRDLSVHGLSASSAAACLIVYALVAVSCGMTASVRREVG